MTAHLKLKHISNLHAIAWTIGRLTITNGRLSIYKKSYKTVCTCVFALIEQLDLSEGSKLQQYAESVLQFVMSVSENNKGDGFLFTK